MMVIQVLAMYRSRSRQVNGTIKGLYSVNRPLEMSLSIDGGYLRIGKLEHRNGIAKGRVLKIQ